mgnify:FL=1
MSLPRFAVNPLVAATDAPPIPAAKAWLAEYDGRRGPMIDLSQAVPGTPPPDEMLIRLGEAARRADSARYGPILGDGLLREALAAETARLYGGSVPVEAVAITAGCNQAFVVAMMALARAGEAVILPAPWYFNHKMILDMLGIEARILPVRADSGFIPDPDEAAALIDARTRAIVLVTPNNPTGAVIPPATVDRFAELAASRGLALVLDETYRDFLPEGQARAHHLFAGDWGATLVQLYSFSKAHAVPGHRLGSVVAAPGLIREIEKILDCLQICPARAAQPVIAWAVEALRPWREAQRQELARRARLAAAELAQAPGWRLDSIGAYFAYVAHPFGPDATAAARRLALEGGVLGLPASYFGPGQETHLRLAFANVDAGVLVGLAARLSSLA